MIENERPEIRIVSLSEQSFSSAAKPNAGSDKTERGCDTDPPCDCDEGPKPCETEPPCDIYQLPCPSFVPCSPECVDQSDTPPCDCVDQSDTPPCDCVDQSESSSLQSSIGEQGRQQPTRGTAAARTFFKIA